MVARYLNTFRHLRSCQAYGMILRSVKTARPSIAFTMVRIRRTERNFGEHRIPWSIINRNA
jgi:ribosomal protein L34E